MGDEERGGRAPGLAETERFQDVETWIFDLDNTLYPARARLLDQIHLRMTDFIAIALEVDAREADQLRARYWREHGATMNGLMIEHDVAPEAFLEFVHDIDLSALEASPRLSAAISALPGRKVVHTNGSRRHAARVLDRLGMAALFEATFAIEDSGFTPKPQRAAYDRVAAQGAIDPRRAAMIEDSARNLLAPHAMGMATIWTPSDHPGSGAAADAEGGHVHVVADDLTAFLEALAAGLSQA